jgi:ferritin
MELSDSMQKALNDQANAELYSAYLYLSMSGYFDSINLSGFAHWMRMQAQEEAGHATKIYDYVSERRGRMALQAIDEPPASWDSPLAVFEATLEHEQKVTAAIDSLVAAAREEGDNATEVFLQWYVNEQVEEEASADEIVQQLRMIGDATGPLFTLDRALAGRGGE